MATTDCSASGCNATDKERGCSTSADTVAVGDAEDPTIRESVQRVRRSTLYNLKPQRTNRVPSTCFEQERTSITMFNVAYFQMRITPWQSQYLTQ